MFSKRAPLANLFFLFLVANFFLRLVLLLHPITQSSFSFGEIIKVFVTGFSSDLMVFIVSSAFLWLYLLFLSDSKYSKPWGYIIFGLMLALLSYVSFFNTVLNEYAGALPSIVIGFIGLKTLLFGLSLFLPKWRKQLRLILFSIAIFIFTLVIIQNTISEFFFWNEFGVRYNFIAVDYLVYTNEVIKNIMESYPVIPLFTSVGVITLIITYFIVKRSKPFLDNLPSFAEKIKSLGIYIVLFIGATFLIPVLSKQETSHNVFANELQANGMYRFYLAFMNSELDYDKFYKTMPETDAFALLQRQISAIAPDFSARTIQNTNPEIRKNVVLITIESLSADFLKAYGNEQNITPFLDSLALQSLQFSNLYAVGNRTVRGIESVTLCLPPTAGESVVKRKDNKNKFSTGYVFKTKGYSVNFLYGGDAYFDNMEDFFGGNGYRIIDKKTLKPEEITFSNVWGVCDEDMAKKAITIMNEEAKTGKPFFNHWMTVSNHRPYTYPDGKINIDSHAKMREGGVKYTDYALKQFFAMAQKQAWFKNTVFLIVADHCASSSGHVQLPLDKYRIPAMIYAPGFIQPSVCNKLISQIDLMPTLFGLLNFNYQTKFLGQDVLKDDYKPRAFLATYQDLGLLKDTILTLLSPKQKVKQFQLKLQPKGTVSTDFQIYFEQTPLDKQREDLVNETVSYYQTASNLLKNKKFDK